MEFEVPKNRTRVGRDGQYAPITKARYESVDGLVRDRVVLQQLRDAGRLDDYNRLTGRPS